MQYRSLSIFVFLFLTLYVYIQISVFPSYIFIHTLFPLSFFLTLPVWVGIYVFCYNNIQFSLSLSSEDVFFFEFHRKKPFFFFKSATKGIFPNDYSCYFTSLLYMPGLRSVLYICVCLLSEGKCAGGWFERKREGIGPTTSAGVKRIWEKYECIKSILYI